ncbi:TonB-dependent receptor [Hydrogenovibrio sp. JE_KL2]|uniref:TonB-dependent receptor n=1 Tax=Hydrogenovibrio sp. JE_KL2 TaxID=2651188 RepID=UPI00128E5BCA|nr:TonB-dependent receptor [Hydrogenovibrio sp. JE_KL2]MPQ76740.1 TonB-dependent receptor [Hydrogenovibrio sp. JE_KL2]
MKKKLTLGIFAAMAVSPAYAKEEVTQLKPLTVTANKQSQSLDTVKGTVLVKTAEELQQAGVETVEDLEKVFPGLLIRTRGNRAYAGSTIRGISSPDYYNPSVMLYVDGVPQDSAFLTQPLVNVERVELLKGPQGTLYGRNAEAGVINIITKQATDKSQADVGVTYAGLTREAKLSASGALVKHTLYGNISLKRNDNVGQIKDIGTGKKNIDDSTDFMGMARLQYAPENSRFSAGLSVSHEDLDSNEEIYLREANLKDLEYNSLTDGKYHLDREVTSYALKMDYELDHSSLSSVTSYQDRKLGRVISSQDYPEKQASLSQEFKLITDYSARLNSLVGAFFQTTDFTRNQPGYPGYYGDSENKLKTNSYGLFGELNYQFSSKWDSTFGLRWSQDESKINYARETPNAFGFDNQKTFNEISPKFSVGWNYAGDNRIYYTAAEGYKPGGFNHAVTSSSDATPFDSQTSFNNELGWRSYWLNRTLSLNAALYLINTSNTQIYVGPVGQQVIRNAGDAQSYGLDMDAKWSVTRKLLLSMGLTQGRSEFKNVKDPQTNADYDGKLLPYAPQTTASLSGRYELTPSWVTGKLFVNAGVRYYSDIYFNEANTLKQPSYSTVDASMMLQMKNGLKLRAFVDNATDEIYRTSSFVFGANDVRSTVGQGRNVGLTAEMAF